MGEELRHVCVKLGDEQVLVDATEDGVPLRKYALRIKDGEKLRGLTRDEQLAFAAAPGTAAERAAAVARVGATRPFEFVLEPRPFLAGEKELVTAQLERGDVVDTDGLH